MINLYITEITVWILEMANTWEKCKHLENWRKSKNLKPRSVFQWWLCLFFVNAFKTPFKEEYQYSRVESEIKTYKCVNTHVFIRDYLSHVMCFRFILRVNKHVLMYIVSFYDDLSTQSYQQYNHIIISQDPWW